MFCKRLVSILLGLSLLGHLAMAQEVADTVPLMQDMPDMSASMVVEPRILWPGENWEMGQLPGQSEGVVHSLVEAAMAGTDEDLMGETRQIVIIHKGQLVLEAYAPGFEAETRLVSWSMAKSITQALIGRAVQQGLIEGIDAPLPSIWDASDPRAQISWRQWMSMTDGLDYREVGEQDLSQNDVVQMMFGPGRFDMLGYIQGLPLLHEPGTHWNYSTAAYHMLGHGLAQTLHQHSQKGAGDASKPFQDMPASEKKAALRDWIEANLFAPLGMSAQAEFDAAGTLLAGSLVYASARDFARFGYLYLQEGLWQGERLLPEDWVNLATRAHVDTGTNVYGAGWWITPGAGQMPSHSQSAYSPPYDAYHAGGSEGQTLWIVPSRDLVIVRLGLMENEPRNWAALYEWNQKIARAFPEKSGQ